MKVKALLRGWWLLAAGLGAPLVAGEAGPDDVRSAIIETLSKPRYAWRTVFERVWERKGTGLSKISTASYLYRGETDTERHYAVVQTSVQMMLFGRQDSEDPALLVFHNQDAVARYDSQWRTARQIAEAMGAESYKRWEEQGRPVIFSLTVPAPHRILPVIGDYLSNFREEDGAVVADIVPSDLAGLMALRIIEPQPLLTPVTAPAPPVVAGLVRARATPEEARRRLNDRYQTGAGTARFWLKEDRLEKYELRLYPTTSISSGDLEFRGAKEITITTEFRPDPASVEVPSEAMELLRGL